MALLANAFAWGVSWWPFRLLQDFGVHPLWATALVYALALAGLLLTQTASWRNFLQSPLLWALALAAGLTNMGFNWAVTVGDVVRVVLLFYLMPAWVVLLAWPLLGEKPSASSLWHMVLAMAGVLIILKTPESSWPWPQALADWLAMFAGGALLSTVAALAGMQLGLVNPLPTLASNWLVWVGALSLMFLLGNLGLQYGAARLSASATSIIMLTEVVFASVSAIALGAGQVTAELLAGGLCIFAASVLSITRQQA